jgi:hypothetical protein
MLKDAEISFVPFLRAIGVLEPSFDVSIGDLGALAGLGETPPLARPAQVRWMGLE